MPPGQLSLPAKHMCGKPESPGCCKGWYIQADVLPGLEEVEERKGKKEGENEKGG